MTPPTLRVVVVDDEALSRESLRVILSRDDDVEILRECDNGPDAVKTIRELSPDLVFLDIQIPGGSGLDVAASLDGATMPAIVFVTAFDEHAVEAFELHAIDYVLKPYDDERLEAALVRVKRAIRSGQAEQRLEGLLRALQSRVHSDERRLAVRDGNRVQFIDLRAIDWIEAADQYVLVHAADDRHLLRQSMNAVEKELPATSFARIHRKAIVNLARVKEVRVAGKGDYRVTLADGTELTLSRRRRDELAERLGWPL